MHYILHVLLAQFYVKSLIGRDRTLSGRPIAVHRDKAILDANREAIAFGVCPGMALAEAKTLFKTADEARLPALICWQQDLFRDSQERWLDLCAELTDIVEPETQHSATLDMSAYPDPFELAERLKNDLKSGLGLQAKLGLARSKWIARLAAEQIGEIACGPEWRIASRQALDNPAAFIGTFSAERLQPALPEHRRRLLFLGYRTIGQAANIPIAALRGQFGEQAPLIQAAARGGVHEKVHALYPSDKAQARVTFDGGAESLEALQNAQTRLAKRVGKTLQRLDSQGSLLELQIEYESGKIEGRKRRFARPVSDPRTALSALKLLLGERFPEPVVAIRAVFPGLQKVVRSQPGLSGDASASARPTNLENAFSAIRTVFGDKAVQAAGDIAQPRRTRLLKAWKEATGWL